MEEHFYESLPVHQGTVGAIFNKDHLFAAVPPGWEIVLTDISGSTAAVAEGMHKAVNLIATGSIVCVLNIAHKHKIAIPFFFGGDGATFLVPKSLLAEVLETVWIYRNQTASNFGLALRVGNVSVAEVYASGQTLKIAKFSSSASFTIPMILGNGLNFAEQLIKGANSIRLVEDSGKFEVDLSGLQCRWDQIPPPVDTDEVITLLVSAVKLNDQGPAFSKVLAELDNIYGVPKKRQPISESKLRINSTLRDVGMTMLVRVGTKKWYAVLKEWFSVAYEYLYFKTGSGKTYLTTLVEMSDTLVLDGRINTVISGNREKRKQLLSALTYLEKNGEILYGIHVSNASVMSCYVPDHMDGHIHFVDGSGGGYTQASRMLKAKINN
ncbi:MAG: DUF3095 family protein [Mucilaginibacter sp.]|uniref:DUF3095 family protein n=1 Tax=Mucilaginibacter sp. TaxID=1882438 RepID=UPI0032677872